MKIDQICAKWLFQKIETDFNIKDPLFHLDIQDFPSRQLELGEVSKVLSTNCSFPVSVEAMPANNDVWSYCNASKSTIILNKVRGFIHKINRLLH